MKKFLKFLNGIDGVSAERFLKELVVAFVFVSIVVTIIFYTL